MRKIILVTGILAGAGICATTFTGTVGAADLGLPEGQPQAVSPAECGPCGCLGVTYERHAVLLSTYGAGFDPRNYDTTQPHYYFGPVRAFPRYTVDGVPVTEGHC